MIAPIGYASSFDHVVDVDVDVDVNVDVNFVDVVDVVDVNVNFDVNPNFAAEVRRLKISKMHEIFQLEDTGSDPLHRTRNSN